MRQGKVNRKCANCGVEFNAVRKDACTCSARCRAADNRKRKKINKMGGDIFGMLEAIDQHAKQHGGWLQSQTYHALIRSQEAIEYLIKEHGRQLDMFLFSDTLSNTSASGENPHDATAA